MSILKKIIVQTQSAAGSRWVCLFFLRKECQVDKNKIKKWLAIRARCVYNKKSGSLLAETNKRTTTQGESANENLFANRCGSFGCLHDFAVYRMQRRYKLGV